MMKAFFFSFFVFFCASLAINAQYIAITRESFPNIDTVIPRKYSELLSDTNATALRTTWVATRPGDLWFFSLEGGINWPRSENWRELYWKDRFRNMTLGFNFGRYFTPVWGLRLETTFSREHMFSPDPRLYPPNGGESPWYIGQYHTNELGTMSSNSYVVNDTPERAEFIYERFLKGEPEYIGRRGTQGFYYDITYVGITIDFLLNLRNFTSHYNPKARWNPVMFIGVGYAHTFKERERTAVNSIMNRMGFQWNLRIHKHWNLYLTLPECIMVPEVWDRRAGSNETQDLILSALVGLTYHLGSDGYIRPVTYCPECINERVNAVLSNPCNNCCNNCNNCCNNGCNNCNNGCNNCNNGCNNCNNGCNNCNNGCNNCNNGCNNCCNNCNGKCGCSGHHCPEGCPPTCTCGCQGRKAPAPEPARPTQYAPQPQPVPQAQPARIVQPAIPVAPSSELEPVYFTLDSYVVRDNQMLKIEHAVSYLEHNPEAKLELMAYADVETGNPSHNWTLSRNRVNAVADVMVKEFGISKSRLILNYYGDTVQPYLINERNRVVIFIKYE